MSKQVPTPMFDNIHLKFMSLYTVLRLLSYELMKKNHKNVVCIEGPRQVLSRNSYKQ